MPGPRAPPAPHAWHTRRAGSGTPPLALVPPTMVGLLGMQQRDQGSPQAQGLPQGGPSYPVGKEAWLVYSWAPEASARCPWGQQLFLYPSPTVRPLTPSASLTGPLWPASCRGQNQVTGFHFRPPGLQRARHRMAVLRSISAVVRWQRRRAQSQGGWGLRHLGRPARVWGLACPSMPAGTQQGTASPPPAGGWILTSALRVGLARHVGQAVRDHSLASTSAKARVVSIGIASLGRVLYRQLLDDAPVSPGAGKGSQLPSVTHPRVEGEPPAGLAGWQRPTAHCLLLSEHSPSPPRHLPLCTHRPGPALGRTGRGE